MVFQFRSVAANQPGGAQHIAPRTGSGTGTSGPVYLFTDHLGSTGVTYRASDGQTARQLYEPSGEVRYSSGSLPAKYTFTGNYSYVSEVDFSFTTLARSTPQRPHFY
jgi:hypothetical protein